MTLPVLYHRTATGAINTWRTWTEGADVVCEWGQQGGQLQSSRWTCLEKNVGKRNYVSPEDQAHKEAEAKHKAQLRKKYTETLAEIDESHTISPMLAQDYAKRAKSLKFPVMIQAKYDGVRCMAHFRDGEVVLQSRGNKTYSMPHITHALKEQVFSNNPSIILDGELFNPSLDLQTINSLVRRPREESVAIQYWVYDVMNDKPFSGRFMDVCSLRLRNPLVQVPTGECDSPEEVERSHAVFVAEGFEGAIVRSLDGKYRAGYRSPDLLKVKAWLDSEFRIIGWTTGKGKFSAVPIFRCVTDEGQEFDVSPTGTQEQRAEMLANADSIVGKMMTVKYFQMSPDGKPLYPVGLNVREEHE